MCYRNFEFSIDCAKTPHRHLSHLESHIYETNNMFTFISALLSFTALVAATPLYTVTKDTAWSYGLGGGFFGFLVLLLDLYIFIEIFKGSRPVERKFLWSVLVFIFPLLGALVYFLFAERSKYNEYAAIEESA